MTCAMIIPLPLLSSAPDTAVLDLASKESLARDCNSSDCVSLRGSLKPISSVKWKQDSWHKFLFGRICGSSHTQSFEDWWISRLRESRANHTATQGNDKADQTSGSCLTNGLTDSNSCNQASSSSRTSKDCSQAKCQMELFASSGQSKDLNAWVTGLRQAYSARLKSVRLTKEKGCSSSVNWPTAAARDWKGCGNAVDRKDGKHRLDTLEAVALFGPPAPASSSTSGNRQGSCNSWATPKARDHKGSEAKNYPRRDKSNNLNDHVAYVEKPNAKLNPRWVEVLMGVPIGWVQPAPDCGNRTDELRLLGNGVVVATAEKAFKTLLKEMK